ncbi:MAG: hypothetical protein ACRD0W_07830 [Acidimicrobiales bacterium]
MRILHDHSIEGAVGPGEQEWGTVVRDAVVRLGVVAVTVDGRNVWHQPGQASALDAGTVAG